LAQKGQVPITHVNKRSDIENTNEYPLDRSWG